MVTSGVAVKTGKLSSGLTVQVVCRDAAHHSTPSPSLSRVGDVGAAPQRQSLTRSADQAKCRASGTAHGSEHTCYMLSQGVESHQRCQRSL